MRFIRTTWICVVLLAVFGILAIATPGFSAFNGGGFHGGGLHPGFHGIEFVMSRPVHSVAFANQVSRESRPRFAQSAVI